jgi:hypothetical protein
MKHPALHQLFIMTCILCGALSAKPPVPKDMILTTADGKMDILLKEDSTWVIQRGGSGEIEEDFTVPVSGGKIVLISTDGTWGYVSKEIKKEREIIPADSVTARGHAVNSDVAVANALAEKEALSQAVARMKITLKNVKIDQKQLAGCVKRVEKDVDKKEEFKKGVGWEVTIRMKLDRGSILAVADCAMIPEKKAGDSAAVPAK